ncbi:MAG TPA: hypothetical protein VLG40_04570 [Candidatus Saccharimonas sp.]|nr:hypothetical protein [Candidatus Saccharimonas sp.]
MPSPKPPTTNLALRLKSAALVVTHAETELRLSDAKAQSFLRDAEILDAIPQASRGVDYIATTAHVSKNLCVFHSQLERNKDRYVAAVVALHAAVVDIAGECMGKRIQPQCQKLIALPMPAAVKPGAHVITQAAVAVWLANIMSNIQADRPSDYVQTASKLVDMLMT